MAALNVSDAVCLGLRLTLTPLSVSLVKLKQPLTGAFVKTDYCTSANILGS